MDLVMGVSNQVIVLDAGANDRGGNARSGGRRSGRAGGLLGRRRASGARPQTTVAIAAQKPLIAQSSAPSAGYGAATVVRRADLEIAGG